MQLIDKLNNKYISGFYLIAIHLSMLTKNEPIIQVIMAHVFVLIVFIKLYQYCMFMQYPKKYYTHFVYLYREHEALVKDESFIREALVLTCLSIMLEIVGQLFISVTTSVGYLVYYFQYD